MARRVAAIRQHQRQYAQHHDEQGRNTASFPAIAAAEELQIKSKTPWWAWVGESTEESANAGLMACSGVLNGYIVFAIANHPHTPNDNHRYN